MPDYIVAQVLARLQLAGVANGDLSNLTPGGGPISLVQGWTTASTMAVPASGFSAGALDVLAAQNLSVRDVAVADQTPRAAIQIDISSAGSGRGGYAPRQGRNGLQVLCTQDNYLTNVNGGQMGCLAYVHQVGANTDGEFLGCNATFVSGYFGTLESTVSQVSQTGALQQQLQINIGSVNNPVPGSDGGGSVGGGGFTANATAGALDDAFSSGQNGGTWENHITCGQVGGALAFQVAGNGDTVIGGALSLALATVAQTATGSRYDPAKYDAGSILLITNGNHGQPCVSVNYGGWHIGLDPAAPLVSAT